LKLADRVYRDYGGEFPVPVRQMVADRAELLQENWDLECDALTVGLDTPRPKVFLRSGATYEPRVRFTLAHELGHLVIPWHTGVKGCAPGPGLGGLVDQEQEANRFAGSLLLPPNFARHAFSEYTLADAFERISHAEMSAVAFALTMARYLIPGFALFAERSGGDDPLLVWSRGSSGFNTSLTNAIQNGIDRGMVLVAGKRVDWVRFVDQQELVVAEDERSTSQILRDAIATAGSTVDPHKLFMSVNGVVGGKLSTDRTSSAEGMYAALRHNFDLDRRIPAVVKESADFDLYLVRKAQERAARIANS
jgi:hypothetical protein